MSRLIRFFLGLFGPARVVAVFALLLLSVSALAADTPPPPCGSPDHPAWCATADTGFVTVVTRGERQEYATAGLGLQGPVGRGLQVRMRGELYGVQDGGRLDFGRPQSFRAILLEGELFKTLGKRGQFTIAARGGTTLSVEGGVAAPIDPRLIKGEAEVVAHLRGVIVRLRGGHDGTAGGPFLGAGLDVPIRNAPDLVSDYRYPLSRPGASVALPLPWVVTAGARLTFGTWGLAGLFQ